MVDTLTWVLAGIVVYTVGVMTLRARGKLPESVRVSGPIVTVHTGRGRDFLDWLAAPKRFWRAWGNLGVGAALVVMLASAAAVFASALAAIEQPQQTAFSNPQNALVIPGVNDFLPLAAAPEIVFGLAVGLVVHEGGHGLLCRVEDIDIDSMGLAFFAFFPVGAFVEPDEESRNEASRGSQTRMFAAGVTNNFFITLLAFLLLFGPVAGSISVAAGLPVGDVLQGSSADQAGLEHGDVVTGVDGTPVANESQFRDELERTDGRTVPVTTRDGRTVTINRSLLVTRAVPGVMDGVELNRDEPTVIAEVNGTAVYTERQFAREVTDRSVISLETTRGNATFPLGAYVASVPAGEPLAGAGAPTNDSQVILTSVNGDRVTNATALADVLADTESGERVPVVAYVDGERETYQVELGSADDGSGYLGVRLAPGYSGLVLDDMGIDAYPAGQFLGFLGGNTGPLGGLFTGDFLRNAFATLVLPFFGAFMPGSAYNFAGFIDPIANFYAVGGPLGGLGGGVFLLANVLFWTAWINLNLGLFNCIPMFPLDGGHILRASAESFVARVPVSDGHRLTSALTASISVVMLIGLGLLLFAPQIL